MPASNKSGLVLLVPAAAAAIVFLGWLFGWFGGTPEEEQPLPFAKQRSQPTPDGPTPIAPPKKLVQGLKLVDQSTQQPWTDVSLRLPQDCRWDPVRLEAVHPQLEIHIGIHPTPGISLNMAVAQEDEIWKKPDCTLAKKETLKLGSADAVLFTGHEKDAGGGSSVQVLIVGNDRDSTIITAQAPPIEELTQVLRESLQTARWQVRTPADWLAQFPFTLAPAPGLQLGLVYPGPRKADFVESGKPLMPQPGEAFFAVSTLPLPPGMVERKAVFEAIVKKLPGFAEPKIETIRPVTIDALPGFEAIGSVYHEPTRQTMFGYTVGLFADEGEMYLLWGMVAMPRREVFEPKFRQTAQSFKRK